MTYEYNEDDDPCDCEVCNGFEREPLSDGWRAAIFVIACIVGVLTVAGLAQWLGVS